MKINLTEYRADWRARTRTPYKKYSVDGETETECFERIYTGFIRPSRYCNDVSYCIDDAEQQKRFEAWKQHGVTFEMFYGNATVD